MTLRSAIVWMCQIVAAAIIGFAGATKFAGTEGNVYIFTVLGMEPFGRHLIGAIEIGAALLLLTPGFSAIGALLAVGTMLGATIAHVTYLGVSVQGDNGLHILMLVAVWVTALTVLIARRKNLPLLGGTL